jgi:hypothetical protein
VFLQELHSLNPSKSTVVTRRRNKARTSICRRTIRVDGSDDDGSEMEL